MTYPWPRDAAAPQILGRAQLPAADVSPIAVSPDVQFATVGTAHETAGLVLVDLRSFTNALA
jgi:hypothetical protein